MAEANNVLLLESGPRNDSGLDDALTEAGFRLARIANLGAASLDPASGPFDVAVINLGNGGAGEGDDIERLQELLPGLPAIAVIDGDDAGIRLDLVRNGAHDVVVRDGLTSEKIAHAIECAVLRTRFQHIDSLTGLPNRSVLMDRLSHAIDHGRRYDEMFALMFLDLDHFKAINDTFGHAIGDHVLQTVAARLRDCLRETDTVARMGGDEFVALLDTLPRDMAAAEVAQKVIDRVSEPIEVGEAALRVAPSVGISLYPSDGDNAEQLLQSADAAMYQAKARGSGAYVFFRPDMNAKDLRRMGLAFALRGGLKREEFELFYQPRIALDTGRVDAVEALLRWRHPERGLVTPEHFLPMARELGLITPIGNWSLGAACEQLRRWRSEQWPGLKLAVNVSPEEFVADGLVAELEDWLARTTISPTALEIELGAECIPIDCAASADRLRSLTALGVAVTIDGFGNGAMSLSQLRRLPIAALKIDRALTVGLADDGDAAAIVRTIIQMAASLDLDVIASGAETMQQISLLRSMGCNLIQGHAVSPPVAADQLPASIGRIEAHAREAIRSKPAAGVAQTYTPRVGVV